MTTGRSASLSRYSALALLLLVLFLLMLLLFLTLLALFLSLCFRSLIAKLAHAA